MIRKLLPDGLLFGGVGILTGGLWTWLGSGPALTILGLLLVFVGLRIERENQRGGLG